MYPRCLLMGDTKLYGIALALRTLCTDPSTHSAIMRKGGSLDTLVSLLRCPSPAVQLVVLDALQLLASGSPETRVGLRKNARLNRRLAKIRTQQGYSPEVKRAARKLRRKLRPGHAPPATAPPQYVALRTPVLLGPADALFPAYTLGFALVQTCLQVFANL